MKFKRKNKDNQIDIVECPSIIRNMKSLMKAYNCLAGLSYQSKSSQSDVKVFNTRNFVGDYAEMLMCSLLGLEREHANKKGDDASSPENSSINNPIEKYQIKSRLIMDKDNQRYCNKDEFGGVSKNSINNNEFQELLLVRLYAEDLNKYEIYLIHASEICNIFVQNGNGYFRPKYGSKAFNKGLAEKKILPIFLPDQHESFQKYGEEDATGKIGLQKEIYSKLHKIIVAKGFTNDKECFDYFSEKFGIDNVDNLIVSFLGYQDSKWNEKYFPVGIRLDGQLLFFNMEALLPKKNLIDQL